MLHPEALKNLLCSIPADVWHQHWPPGSTRILRQTCKALQPVVDGLHLPHAMRLPVAIRMSRTWWHSHAGRPSPTKWAHVLERLSALVASANVTSLDLLCGSWGHGAQVTSLIRVLRECPRLEHLYINSSGYIGASDAPLIAAALQPCTAITSLHLPSNQLGPSGMLDLVPLLGSLVRLTVLDLSWNGLGDRGAEALGDVLELCPSLASLNLFANRIHASGATVFALSVRRCTALTELDVGSNELMNLGASALCTALARCPRLAHLELSNNR